MFEIQANRYDSVRDQHGYMKYFHKWLILKTTSEGFDLHTVDRHVGELLHVSAIYQQVNKYCGHKSHRLLA